MLTPRLASTTIADTVTIVTRRKPRSRGSTVAIRERPWPPGSLPTWAPLSCSSLSIGSLSWDAIQRLVMVQTKYAITTVTSIWPVDCVICSPSWDVVNATRSRFQIRPKKRTLTPTTMSRMIWTSPSRAAWRRGVAGSSPRSGAPHSRTNGPTAPKSSGITSISSRVLSTDRSTPGCPSPTAANIPIRVSSTTNAVPTRGQTPAKVLRTRPAGLPDSRSALTGWRTIHTTTMIRPMSVRPPIRLTDPTRIVFSNGEATVPRYA